jgi:hypothetical protein
MVDIWQIISDIIGNAFIAGGWPVQGQREKVPLTGGFFILKIPCRILLPFPDKFAACYL